jgi:Reverse transcriptase (RNA-dependent DNA polymerase)
VVDGVYTSYLKNPTPESKARYLIRQHQYTACLRDAKKKYNCMKIKAATNRQKAAWQLINNNKKGSENREIAGILKDDRGVTIANRDVSNCFNEYFSSNIADLIKTRGKPCNRVSTPWQKRSQNIFLYPMSGKEFYETIQKVTRKRSAGYDEIPCHILKKIAGFIANPLMHIVNESTSQGIFPERLKKVVVIPCFKNGDRTKKENYRPIALTSVFSKVIELAIHRRISNFISQFELMNSAQHGFIKNRSTTTALVEFVEKIMNTIDNREEVLGIFYDCTKAFETLNHDLLLFKLHQLGIAGVANNWVKSFLKDRIQIVQTHDNVRSYLSGEVAMENIGVPQGAIISPLLFVLFTNDLSENVSVGSVTLYADDTTHHVSDKSSNIVKAGREAVREIQDYSEKNDLFLNKKKSGPC